MTERDEADKIIAKAMMYLIQTAANDGIITPEEVEIIDTFEFSLKKYERALQRAYEDNIIDDQEEQKLNDFKDVIISEGRVVANLIDGISKDELNLLISMMLSLEVPKADNPETDEL